MTTLLLDALALSSIRVCAVRIDENGSVAELRRGHYALTYKRHRENALIATRAGSVLRPIRSAVAERDAVGSPITL